MGLSKRLSLLRRVTQYLAYLKSAGFSSEQPVSAALLSRGMGIPYEVVSADLRTAAPSHPGYCAGMIAALEGFLGFDIPHRAVLVGAGRIGQALLHSKELPDSGVEILAAFDTDEKIQKEHGVLPVLPVERLTGFCLREQVKLGILAVPDAEAEHLCGILLRCGVEAVWNLSNVWLWGAAGNHGIQ